MFFIQLSGNIEISEYTNEVGFWKGGFRVFLKKNLGSGSGFGFSKNEKKNHCLPLQI